MVHGNGRGSSCLPPRKRAVALVPSETSGNRSQSGANGADPWSGSVLENRYGVSGDDSLASEGFLCVGRLLQPAKARGVELRGMLGHGLLVTTRETWKLVGGIPPPDSRRMRREPQLRGSLGAEFVGMALTRPYERAT